MFYCTERAKNANPDKAVHKEPPHLDLRCLQTQLFCFSALSSASEADDSVFLSC